MRRFRSQRSRRFTVRLGVAVAAISTVCAGGTQLVVTTPKSVAIEVTPTAEIVEEPTVGVADSSLYLDSPEQIDQTLNALQALGVQNVRS